MLDVKEPLQGALGRADWSTISAVTKATAWREDCPVSAALGELTEWLSADPLPLADDRPTVLCRLQFVKLGLAGMRGRASLLDDFQRVVERVQSSAFASPQWIAVVYADWQLADAPTPRDVLALVDQLREQTTVRIGGLLIDTFTKGEQRLFDFAALDELAALRKATRERELSFAVAGRLRASDLPLALEVEPDIVAVRSAVCGAGDRMNAVTQDAVNNFRALLYAAARGSKHA